MRPASPGRSPGAASPCLPGLSPRVTSLQSWPEVTLRRSGHQGTRWRECAPRVLQDGTKRGVTRARPPCRGGSGCRGAPDARVLRRPGVPSWPAGAHTCGEMVTRVEPQVRGVFILFLIQIARSSVSRGTPVESNVSPPGAPPSVAEVKLPTRFTSLSPPEGGEGAGAAFGVRVQVVLSPACRREGDLGRVTLGTPGLAPFPVLTRFLTSERPQRLAGGRAPGSQGPRAPDARAPHRPRAPGPPG